MRKNENSSILKMVFLKSVYSRLNYGLRIMIMEILEIFVRLRKYIMSMTSL